MYQPYICKINKKSINKKKKQLYHEDNSKYF